MNTDTTDAQACAQPSADSEAAQLLGHCAAFDWIMEISIVLFFALAETRRPTWEGEMAPETRYS